MYEVSQSIIDLFNQHYRQVLRITFKGKYEEFIIDETEVIQGGFTTDRYSVSGSKIELGSAIAAELTLKIKNYDGKYDETVFEGGELFVEVGIKKWDAHKWENAPIHFIPCGYFIIDTPPRAKTTINISALDRMVLFDKEADLSQITFPITVENLIEQVCEICGVAVATDLSKLTNSDYIITAVPTTQSLTYRTLIQWCAFLTATCAYMNHDGRLVFQWYEQTHYPVTPSERYSSDMYENDITLTGLVYTGSDNGVYVVGETTYSLTYSSCDILQNNVESALSNIYYAIRGFTYRPYEAIIKPAPFLYPMDMIEYTDAKGVVHNTIVTHVTFTANNNTSIAGSGETSVQNNYVSSSGLTAEQQQAISEMKNSIEVTISSQELAGLNLCQILANAMGYNLTIVTDDDTQIFYIHNNSTVATSDSIYTLRNGHIAFTDNWNNGNPRWTTTITQANNIILKVLSQYKLTGDNIANGAITESHLANALKSALTLEITTSANSALTSAKGYTDNQIDDTREYVDTGIAGAKNYSDSNLTTAKGYTDTKTSTALQSAKAYTDDEIGKAKTYADGKASDALTSAKGYTDNQIDDTREYVDNEVSELNTVLSEVRTMAKLIYIEGNDGVEYAGKIKVVNGKPVFEYDTTEGG